MLKAGSSLSWVPLFVPLLYHNLGDLSRGFYIFSEFFSRAPTPVLHSQWQAFVYGYPLPLTPLVYHRQHQKSIGNNAQIREKMRAEVCTKCELIFFERCDIMEILPGAFDLGQPKTKGEVLPSPNLNFDFFITFTLKPRFMNKASATTAPIMATHFNAPTIFKAFCFNLSHLCATSAPRTFRHLVHLSSSFGGCRLCRSPLGYLSCGNVAIAGVLRPLS